MRFRDRVEAGQRLAAVLNDLILNDPNGNDPSLNGTVVVGMPRGGVPVAAQVALAFDLPLDVVLVRKLGVPSHPELAMGAIGEDSIRFLDDQTIQALDITPDEIAAVERRERKELERRVNAYRQGTQRVQLAGKAVWVIDDGIATGATARVACRVVRAHGAERVVLAVPIAPLGWDRNMRGEADAFVAVTEQNFRAVGELYDNFEATTDDEVVQCLLASSLRKRPR
ncbi:MAG: hypothetical protein HY826_03475 [Actinobacteria bacterium]|nr:hypothetical protein [Actinomycetota bacterium]